MTDLRLHFYPGSDAYMEACTASAFQGDKTRCRWCNSELPKRRRRWCSDKCAAEYGRNHWWSEASSAARMRDGHRCQGCGSDDRSVPQQVHHVVPVRGRHGVTGCHHHLDGLRTLCAPCHLEAHRVLRLRLGAGQQRPVAGQQLRLGDHA